MRKVLVVDSSVLIALTSKGKLDGCLRHWKDEGHEVVIPRAIAEEVIDEPKSFAQEIMDRSPVLAGKIVDSVNRIDSAVNQGLIKVEAVNYMKYSKVMDNVRRHLSGLEVKPEHAIKKGDPEFIALVLQLYGEAKERVFISTLDKGLLRTLKAFSGEVEYVVLEAL